MGSKQKMGPALHKNAEYTTSGDDLGGEIFNLRYENDIAIGNYFVGCVAINWD